MYTQIPNALNLSADSNSRSSDDGHNKQTYTKPGTGVLIFRNVLVKNFGGKNRRFGQKIMTTGTDFIILKYSSYLHTHINTYKGNFFYFLKRLPRWGVNQGPLDLIYFLIFHHLTAEPQRLPIQRYSF
jgi:hypothetical protein